MGIPDPNFSTTVEFQEKIKSSLIEISEELAEWALQGEAVAGILIMLDPSGGLHARYSGMRPTEVLGTIKVLEVSIARKLLS